MENKLKTKCGKVLMHPLAYGFLIGFISFLFSLIMGSGLMALIYGLILSFLYAGILAELRDYFAPAMRYFQKKKFFLDLKPDLFIRVIDGKIVEQGSFLFGAWNEIFQVKMPLLIDECLHLGKKEISITKERHQHRHLLDCKIGNTCVRLDVAMAYNQMPLDLQGLIEHVPSKQHVYNYNDYMSVELDKAITYAQDEIQRLLEAALKENPELAFNDPKKMPELQENLLKVILEKFKPWVPNGSKAVQLSVAMPKVSQEYTATATYGGEDQKPSNPPS